MNWSNCKSWYQKYGSWVELTIAIIFDLILITGHILMAVLPHHKVSLALNQPIFGLIVATIIQFVIGRKFYVNMYKEIFKWRRLGMNTLIGVSSLSAYIWSLYALINNLVAGNDINNHDQFMYFFEIGTSIVTFLLIGEAISNYLKSKVNQDMQKVLQIQVPTALKYDITSKHVQEVNTRDLVVGDYVLIHANARVPSDATIVEHYSYFDESLVTGESAHVYRDVGSKIIGGTINLTNVVIAQINTNPNKSIVATILKRLKKLQSSKTEIQKVADKIAMWFVPTVLILGIASFLIHFFFGYQIQTALNFNFGSIPQFVDPSLANATSVNVRIAIYFAITLVAISCPCALGLATPLAVVVGVGKAGRQGIVFNNINVFEKIKKIDVIAFDKTGTLTKNQMEIIKTFGPDSNYGLILSLVSKANHPLSKLLTTYLSGHKILDISDFEEIAGVGLKGRYQNQIIEISSYNHFVKQNYSFNQELISSEISQNTNICIAINKIVVNAFIVKDTLRDNARDTIRLLKQAKIKTCIISGDNEYVTKMVADELGVDYYYGNCSAFEKEKIVSDFQNQGLKVAFAGDGINDLIALKKADLSINMSLVNESASNLSDISVVNQDVNNIYNAVLIAKKTYRLIFLNFAWAFIYNVVAIPLAFIGFVPAILAVVLMGFSDFAVVLNTLTFSAIEFRHRPKIKLKKAEKMHRLK